MNVYRNGNGYYGYTWSVTFVTPRGNVPKMTIDTSNLIGDSPVGYVQVLRTGSVKALWFEPMPAWMTEVPVAWATPNYASNVEVYVQSNNGDVLKAVCDGSGVQGTGFSGTTSGTERDCSYIYAANSTPIVTNYSLAYLDKQVAQVSINGYGFLYGGSNASIDVTISNQHCLVTSRASTLIICNSTSVPWGSHVVKVNIFGVGDALRVTNKSLHYKQAIYSVNPTSGSFAGGQILTILGLGFRSAASILVGNRVCVLLSATSSNLTCVTPAARLSPHQKNVTSLTVPITVDGFKSLQSYTYDIVNTPIVSSYSPQNVSAAITTTLTILGERLGGNDTVVTVDNSGCNIISVSVRNLTCFLARSPLATPVRKFDIKLYVPEFGYAGAENDVTTLPTLVRGFEVYSVQPSSGSLMGGSNLIIQGFGFLPNSPARHNISLSKNNIQIDSYSQLLIKLGYFVGFNFTEYCNVTSVSFFELACTIPYAYYGNVDSSFLTIVTLNSLPSVSASGENSTFYQLQSFTPTLESAYITYISSTGAVTLQVTGTNLRRGALTTWAGNVECTSNAISNTSAVVICPDMVAGTYKLLSYVDGLGYSAGNAKFSFNVSVASVLAATSQGSAAGGTSLTITGYGFSPICSNNTITIGITGSTSIITLTELVSCSTTSIVALTPNLVSYFGSSSTWSKALPKNITSVTVSTSSTKSKFVTRSISLSVKATPLISSNPGSGFAFTRLNVTVKMSLKYNASLSYIMVGSTLCSNLFKKVSSSKLANWFCSVPTVPAATYSVRANIWPLGYAVLSTGAYPSYISLFRINKLHTVVASSIGGGAIISLSGQGLSSSSSVSICGQLCSGVSNYYSINCSVPALSTADSVSYFESLNITRDLITTISGIVFGSSSRSPYVVDSNYGTYFYDHRVGCYFGINVATGYVVRPFRMRFYPRLQYSTSFHGAVFEGSTDGGKSYVVLGSLDSAHEGWNFIDPSANYSNSWFNAFRYRSTDPMYVSSYCYIAEFQVLGVQAYAKSTCDVTVTSSGKSYGVGNVTYSKYAYTPVVTSLTPNNGTSLGGTPLTLHGLHFSSPLGKSPQVTISGITCKVTGYNDHVINCTTRARSPDQVVPSYLNVFVPGLGYSISADSSVYLYIDRWSALTTWLNQEPPVAGDLVWVPEGQVIMWDVNTPVLNSLLIEGALYVDPEKDVTLDAYYIFVKGGIMQVGTHEQPYEKQAIITLHGDRYDENFV